jgi:hypothetical protein
LEWGRKKGGRDMEKERVVDTPIQYEKKKTKRKESFRARCVCVNALRQKKSPLATQDMPPTDI